MTTSKKSYYASAALFLSLNLLFFSLATATTCSCSTPPPSPKPTPRAPPTMPTPSTPPHTPATPSTPTPTTPTPTTPAPSTPTPTTPSTPTPTAPTPTTPTPSTGTCPRDALRLRVCADVLSGLLGVVVGNPSNTPCCTLFQGLTNLDAAVCLCTALRANVLGINLNVPISLSLLLNACGNTPPSDFQCA